MSTPPTTSSVTSVVVMSSTPASRPESASFSMVWPPVPVAWKTRQSYSASSCLHTAWTHGVVRPNIVRPRAGLPCCSADEGGRENASMPASACAAFASTFSEMRLIPATSVTEYIMQMSEGPT